LLLLKTGINLGDFYRWVESQQLIYLRAINEIPEAMKEKLSAEYWISFDPTHAVKRGVLHNTVRNMIVVFHEKFGITFPPINKELLLAGYINELGLPLEIYTATKWLAGQLFITFEWPSLEKGLTSRREGHWPDAKLMALVIIAVKLSYGLDRVKRKPEKNTDLLATQLPWPKWEKFLREGNDARHGNMHKEGAFGGKSKLQVDVMEADVFMMQDKDMDWYLDWYEKTWLGTNEEEGSGVKNPNKLPQGLLNLFPTEKPETHDLPAAAAGEGTTTTEGEGEAPPPKTKEAKRDLQTRLVELNEATIFEEKGPGIRSGEEYLYFTTEEDLPSQLRTLMQAAADLLGIERKELMQVVTALDVQLYQHILRVRREEKRQKMMAVGGGIQDAVRIRSEEPEQDEGEEEERGQEQQEEEDSEEEPELPPLRGTGGSPEL
jgi:RNA polymerase I-specific transcription initiation factor RRN7